MSRCACCGRPLGPGQAMCRSCVDAGGTVTKKCRDFPHGQKRFKKAVVR